MHAFLDVDYNYVGKVQYICAQNDITIVNTEYADGVTFELMMENAARNVLEKNMTEMSSGKICLRDTCSMQMYRIRPLYCDFLPLLIIYSYFRYHLHNFPVSSLYICMLHVSP